MADAVIIDAVRTPIGARGGALSGWHPADLAGHVLQALVDRDRLDPEMIDDVVLGCATQAGAQSLNLARGAVLAGGLPESVSATTVDRQGASSHQAIMIAAHSIMAGTHDVAIAGGVELVTRVPPSASRLEPRFGQAESPALKKRYRGRGGWVPAAVAAELLAERAGLDREHLDEYAVQSHLRAAAARSEGRFDAEVVPTPKILAGSQRQQPATFASDEEIDPEINAAALGQLRPIYRRNGMVTGGNSAPIADGASAVLLMSEERASELDLTPRARVRSFAVAGVDPVLMLSGAVPASQQVLERCKLSIDDIDCIEVNESFAPIVLDWIDQLHPDPLRVNPNGGAIALGDAAGSSGTRLLATLLAELERTNGRFGLQAMTATGGLANALIIERWA